MIAADTSSLSALLAGESGEDVEQLAEALDQNLLSLPPVVVTEILSDPRTEKLLAPKIGQIPLLEVADGFWNRAGALRSKVLGRGLKAHLGDALVAQSCIDHDVALITRDGDFRHFAKYCGLRLA